MLSLTPNRITRHHDMVAAKLADGGQDGRLSTPEQVAKFDSGLAIEPFEHYAYQEAQARAHATGRLSTDEAQIIYAALGEVMSATNGGWQPHVDTALKVTITTLMGELVAR